MALMRGAVQLGMQEIIHRITIRRLNIVEFPEFFYRGKVDLGGIHKIHAVLRIWLLT